MLISHINLCHFVELFPPSVSECCQELEPSSVKMCLELTVVSGCETQLEQVVTAAPRRTGKLRVFQLPCLVKTQSYQGPRHSS